MRTSLKQRQSSAFTIVELLIVITIIGVLAIISIVAYGSIRQQAQDRAVLSDVDAVESEVARYMTNHEGKVDSAIAWYSPNGINSNIKFTASSGNVIDIVVNAVTNEYCVRVYSSGGSTYKYLVNAATKGSSATACDTNPPSSAAIAAAPTPPAAVMSWTQRTSAGSRDWVDVDVSSDGTKLAAVVASGYVYTSSDSGATWTERTGAGSRTWKEVVISDDGTKLVAISYSPRAVYTSSDSGATWTLRNITITMGDAIASANYSRLSGSDDGTKLVMFIYSDDLCGGELFYSVNSGANWTSSNQYTCSMGTAISSDGTKMLGYDKYGTIFRSTNSGTSWSSNDASSAISGGYWVFSQGGRGSADLSSLLGVTTGSPNRLYRSSNNGLTWSAISGLSAANYTTAVSASGRIQYAAVSSGTGSVWVSENYGASWSEKTGTGARQWVATETSASGSFVVGIYNGTGYIYTGVFE